MDNKDYSYTGSYTENSSSNYSVNNDNYDKSNTYSYGKNNEYNNYSYNEVEDIISTGNWFWTIFVCAVPIINLIMLLIWTFSSNTNENKRNFAKAKLLWVIIASILSFIFSFVLFFALAPLL